MASLCIVPARALKAGLTPTEVLVLLAIGQYTSRDGKGCWASKETIAETAGVGVRHCRRAVIALEHKGLVRRVPRKRPNGADTTDLLSVILDDPEAGGRGADLAPPRGAESAIQSTSSNGKGQLPCRVTNVSKRHDTDVTGARRSDDGSGEPPHAAPKRTVRIDRRGTPQRADFSRYLARATP